MHQILFNLEEYGTKSSDWWGWSAEQQRQHYSPRFRCRTRQSQCRLFHRQRGVARIQISTTQPHTKTTGKEWTDDGAQFRNQQRNRTDQTSEESSTKGWSLRTQYKRTQLVDEPQSTHTPTETPEPIRLSISSELRIKCQQQMENFSQFMVLGLVREHNPGVKRLTTWANTRLHPSFKCLRMRENNYVEIQFNHLDGVKQTLTKYSYKIDNKEICFYPWTPYYELDLSATHKQQKTAL